VRRGCDCRIHYSCGASGKSRNSNNPDCLHDYNDPVQIGFIASLNRPGGNLTGVSVLAVEAGPKLMELLQ
jgi:putative ABC transport system substrate-binding protein